MKWPVTLLVVIVLMLLAFPAIQNGIRYKMNPIEASMVPILDGTEWSPDYSFEKFGQITVGMTTSDVLRILGPCFAVTTYDGEAQWHYTRGRDGRVMSSSQYSTHRRGILFDTNGLVVGKVYEYYFD